MIKSLSDKRLIVKALINGKEANLLLDTGATVGLLSDGIEREYKLMMGKKYNRPLVGAGGEFSAYRCHTFAYLEGKPVSQFLVADIDNVIESIKNQTGIEIQGIMSLPQMRQAGVTINTYDNSITV